MAMIRRRERIRRVSLEELTDDQVRHMTDGWYFFEGFTDIETFAAAWEIHGERLTEEWIAERPGSRPFGWWLVTHGQERPVIDRTATQERVEMLRQSRRNEQFGFLHTHFWPVFQETERHYLERNEQLSEDELTALANRDADQERRWIADDARHPNPSPEYRKAILSHREITRALRN